MNKNSIFLAIGVAAILSVAVTATGLTNIAFADPPDEDGKKGGPGENVCKKKHTGSD